MLFGFCMSRIVTMIMRIVWATRETSVRVAIAANIFVAAGIVLLFVVNVLFAQRIVRACHPHSGWHPIFYYTFIGIYVLIVVTLIMLITSVIQSFYTLNTNTKRIDRDIQLYGQTFYTAISFLPLPMVLLGLVVPRKTRVEKFGQGRFRTKIAILLTSTFFLCLGASYRAGVNYAGGMRPRNDPANYQNKACFYIFNFVVEIIVIYLYVLVRVDQRFFVPDGSHHAGDYLRRDDYYSKRHKEKGTTHDDAGANAGSMIMSEEEVFDDMSPEEVRQGTRDRVTGVDEENGVEREEVQSTRAAAPDSDIASKKLGIPITARQPVHTSQERVIEMSRD